jgi:hypothetical protein
MKLRLLGSSKLPPPEKQFAGACKMRLVREERVGPETGPTLVFTY